MAKLGLLLLAAVLAVGAAASDRTCLTRIDSDVYNSNEWACHTQPFATHKPLPFMGFGLLRALLKCSLAIGMGHDSEELN